MKKIKELFTNRESVWKGATTKKEKEIFSFAEEYKRFLKKAKTERRCAEEIIKELKKEGFKSISNKKKLRKGDKVYKLFKEKVVMALIVGEEQDRWKIVCSHTDSPRLDLKPNPLYEDSELSLLQSHYYGGIKKYHWVNRPLQMIGVVYTKEGKRINISFGEKNNEPKLIISDLLPHLAREQMNKPASKAIEGEHLNIIVGNKPLSASEKELKELKEPIKAETLRILHEKYGMTEEDFAFAEIELVPADDPIDIGFDKSLIGAYGQDDKVCVYTTLQAFKKAKPKTTSVAFFTDKEEIGSTGDTGAQSLILETFAQEYLKKTGLENKITTGELFENSEAISADVTAGLNPTYKEVNDPKNCAYLGRGISIDKYTGSGGKFNTNDASAEYMSKIRKILIKNKIKYQNSELGKIDVGGGGTIAMFLSRYGISTVDAGPGVLGMHSPCELTSKADVYESYRFYKAFLNHKD